MGLHVLLCGRGQVRRFGLDTPAGALREVAHAQSALRRHSSAASSGVTSSDGAVRLQLS